MNAKEREKKKRADAEHKRAVRDEVRDAMLRKSLPIVLHNPKPQKCGECQACCEVIAVHLETPLHTPEDKPNYARCPHQCPSGCSIYHQRPKECRSYYCLYLIGALPGGGEMRPDKFGVLIDFRRDDGGNDVLVLWETRPGALQEPQVVRWVREVKTKTQFVLRKNDYNFNHDDPNYTAESVTPQKL